MEIDLIEDVQIDKNIFTYKPNTAETCAGICRGALGELYQGPSFHTQNEIVIISSLIPQFSWVYFTSGDHLEAAPKEYCIENGEYWKAFRALDYYCQIHQLEWPKGRWDFKSELKIARGMASSTADIVAAVRCIANYYDKPVTQDELIYILSKIERSDSVFLNSLSLFCSSQHEVIMQFDKIPGIYALYMHEPEKVETDGTKAKLLEYYHVNRNRYSKLYGQVIEAFNAKDINGICRASQLSAELSQNIIPKPHFDLIHKKISYFKADGLLSLIPALGSVIGYLFRHRPCIDTMEAVSLFFRRLGSDCNFVEIG